MLFLKLLDRNLVFICCKMYGGRGLVYCKKDISNSHEK